MTQWELATGVVFVERVKEANYLVVRNPASGHSSSAVGMQGGEQTVSIEVDYKALHELGHALGLIHEQSRSDRDEYVEFQWDIIVNGQSNGEFILIQAARI
ncbi:hypothetical protein GE09DRAFT_1219055 [Coniochaeta sp. 2T2.1]|nr:hypothetical protein GE09DRAFT_1219055 [Coniochaeta sp. 2T2.1]